MIRALTFIAFMIALLSDVQGQRFIEVNVSDSVNIKPTAIVYRILVGDYPKDPIAMYSGEVTAASPAFYQERARELAKLLTKNNITFREDKSNDFVIGSFVNNPRFFVDLKDETQLETLTALLKEVKNIYGAISSVTYEDESAYTTILVGKIMKRALLDAQQIAKISGVKIGPVLEIAEHGGFDRSFFANDIPHQFYDNELYHMTAEDLRRTYFRTFSIKYQIVD